MIEGRISKVCAGALTGVALALAFQQPARAATFDLLYNFTANNLENLKGLILGPDDAFYGADYRLVYKLASSSGTWSAQTIYQDSEFSFYVPYAFDAEGVLYSIDWAPRYPTLVRFTPQADRQWTKRVLFTFTRDSGQPPVGGFVNDGQDNLFGQGQGGRSSVVYRLSPSWPQSNVWKKTVVFLNHGSTAGIDLTPDGSGGVYSIAPFLDAPYHAEYWLYHVEKLSNDQWSFSKLYRFNDNVRVMGGSLQLGQKGELFGVAKNFIYRLGPTARGKWTLTVLHKFDRATEGYGVTNGLTLHNSGALYGTTRAYSHNGTNSIFKLSPPAGDAGEWTYETLGVGNFGQILTSPSGAIFGFGHLASCNCKALYKITP